MFLHLHPTGDSNDSGPNQGTDQGTPTSTTIPGEGQTATSTSASSTATPSATPYFIVAAEGVSEETFKDYTQKFIRDPVKDVIVGSLAKARVMALNETEVKDMKQSSLISTVIINKIPKSIKFHSEETGILSSLRKRTAPARDSVDDSRLVVPINLDTRTAVDGIDLGHLRSLTERWDDIPFIGDYVFERNPGRGTYIYVVDDGVNIGLDEFGPDTEEVIVGPDNQSHGTAVASMAVGRKLGVAPDAVLVSVMYSESGGHEQIFQALDATYNHIRRNAREGKAVITMAWGFPTSQPEASYLATYINGFIQSGAVPVCAGGNNGKHAGNDGLFSSSVPAGLGPHISGLITVGAVDELGKRADFSAKCDLQDATSSCLSAYAAGVDLDVRADDGSIHTTSGTSLSAGIVSGLAAYILALPQPEVQSLIRGNGLNNIAVNVEALISDWSWSRDPDEEAMFPNVVWNMALAHAGSPNSKREDNLAQGKSSTKGKLMQGSTVVSYPPTNAAL